MSPAYSASVGAWDVTVDLRSGVTAARRAGGPVHTAQLVRLMHGWRVASTWTNGVRSGLPSLLGVPRAVTKKADELAERISREVGL